MTTGIDIDVASLDEHIESLAEWILKAGSALQGFYVPSRGAFVRDSINPGKKGYSPTSTARSFLALWEFHRFLREEDFAESSETQDVARVLNGITEKFFGLFIKRPNSVRQSGTNGINMFTDSHILMASSIINSGPNLLTAGKIDKSLLHKVSATIASVNQRDLVKWGGGKIVEESQVHDFVTLFALRSLDAFYGRPATKVKAYGIGLRERLKATVLQMLAYNASGETARFDASELAFSLVSMNRLSTQNVSQITRCAATCIGNAQSDQGAFPTARPVSYQAGPSLYVASYEVALALTQLLVMKLYRKERDLCDILIPILLRSFLHVQAYYDYDHGTNFRGWANDHTRRDGLIESWATAIVLTFLIHFRDALITLRQQLVLENLGARYSISRSNDLAWPDLSHAINDSGIIDVRLLNKISDPSSASKLTRAIKKTLVQPIKVDPIQRPGIRRSLLFFGPPGSRKTSLVKQIASSLNWPMVVLSPSEFLCRGLEGFEASAVDVFKNLRRLRRVVVLFDECEDFFRRRPTKPDVESRTVGAFITSGMLPRLQLLHDQRWMLLIVATNSGPEHLDPAVTREGRFDVIQKLDYPVLSAQIKYVRAKLRGRARLPRIAELALRRMARKDFKNDNNKDFKVTFQHLDRLIELLKSNPEKYRKSTVGTVPLINMLIAPPHLV